MNERWLWALANEKDAATLWPSLQLMWHTNDCMAMINADAVIKCNWKCVYLNQGNWSQGDGNYFSCSESKTVGGSGLQTPTKKITSIEAFWSWYSESKMEMLFEVQMNVMRLQYLPGEKMGRPITSWKIGQNAFCIALAKLAPQRLCKYSIFS